MWTEVFGYKKSICPAEKRTYGSLNYTTKPVDCIYSFLPFLYIHTYHHVPLLKAVFDFVRALIHQILQKGKAEEAAVSWYIITAD